LFSRFPAVAAIAAVALCAACGSGRVTDAHAGDPAPLTCPTGTEWVSSTDDVSECTTTSNGRFTSQVDIGAQVAASYRRSTTASNP